MSDAPDLLEELLRELRPPGLGPSLAWALRVQRAHGLDDSCDPVAVAWEHSESPNAMLALLSLFGPPLPLYAYLGNRCPQPWDGAWARAQEAASAAPEPVVRVREDRGPEGTVVSARAVYAGREYAMDWLVTRLDATCSDYALDHARHECTERMRRRVAALAQADAIRRAVPAPTFQTLTAALACRAG